MPIISIIWIYIEVREKLPMIFWMHFDIYLRSARQIMPDMVSSLSTIPNTVRFLGTSPWSLGKPPVSTDLLSIIKRRMKT
jgi:hypothetical protein